MEFDLQRFADEGEVSASAENEATTASTEEQKQEIPEELGGLPEEYAREVLEQVQPEPKEENTPAPEEEKISREDYQAVINEREQLKAQLAAYQRQQSQMQSAPPPQPQPQSQPQYQQPQPTLSAEDAAKIKRAITSEAMAISGMSDDEVASLQYADDDDPRVDQWAQAKIIAQDRIFSALKQAQNAKRIQARQFLDDHQEAFREYTAFAQKVFAEPDFEAVKQFAINEFFEQLTPSEQKSLANSYIHVEQKIATPTEMWAVKNYFEKARAAYRTNGVKRQPRPNQGQQAAKLPRADQLRGTTTTGDGALSATDIEKMLEGDFTKLDPKQQRMMLGFN